VACAREIEKVATLDAYLVKLGSLDGYWHTTPPVDLTTARVTCLREIEKVAILDAYQLLLHRKKVCRNKRVGF
jgi:hypothetical protein